MSIFKPVDCNEQLPEWVPACELVDGPPIDPVEKLKEEIEIYLMCNPEMELDGIVCTHEYGTTTFEPHFRPRFLG